MKNKFLIFFFIFIVFLLKPVFAEEVDYSITKEIIKALKSEKRIYGDYSIKSFNKKNIILRGKIGWFTEFPIMIDGEPTIDTRRLFDDEYKDEPICFSKKIVDVEIELHEPLLEFMKAEITKAEKLNGYEWIGNLNFYTEAFKLSYDAEQLKIYESTRSKLCDFGLVLKPMESIPSLLGGQRLRGQARSLIYNNLVNKNWIDNDIKSPIHDIQFSKKEGRILGHKVRLEGEKLCSEKPKSFSCFSYKSREDN